MKFSLKTIYFLIILFVSILNMAFGNDVNNDTKVGVDDAVIALQVASGTKSQIFLPTEINWAGTWESQNRQYNKNDIVFYNGSSYICILPHTASDNRLPTNNALWELVALKGETGLQGTKGEKGETGLQGQQGIQGEKGDSGPQGPQGIQGKKGEKGDTGPIGLQGIQGEKGEKGDTGPMGLQGIQGEKGPQGPQGIQGEQGECIHIDEYSINKLEVSGNIKLNNLHNNIHFVTPAESITYDNKSISDYHGMLFTAFNNRCFIFGNSDGTSYEGHRLVIKNGLIEFFSDMIMKNLHNRIQFVTPAESITYDNTTISGYHGMLFTAYNNRSFIFGNSDGTTYSGHRLVISNGLTEVYSDMIMKNLHNRIQFVTPAESITYDNATISGYHGMLFTAYNNRSFIFGNSDGTNYSGSRMVINSNNVEVNVDTTINGTVTALNYACSSDIQLKTNVEPIEGALKKVLSMQGIYYNWKFSKKDSKELNYHKKQIGFIAQDMERIIPEVVHTSKDGYKSISYDKLSVLLVEAIKELYSENKKLKEKIDSFENIERRIAILEKSFLSNSITYK